MADKHPPLSDEMISAYLDGELSEAQRQHVEDVLRRDADWQRQYEELKSVRDSLQELPRYELDEDFSARVLHRIRSVSADSQHRHPTGSNLSPRADRTPRGFRRGLVWAALAVAVAVMLMVVPRPDGNPGDQVAQVPAGAEQEPAAAKSTPAAQGRLAVDNGDAARVRSNEAHSEPLVDRSAEAASPSLIDRHAVTADAQLAEHDRQSLRTELVSEFRAVLEIDVTPDQLAQVESRLAQDRVPIVRRLADRDSIRQAVGAVDSAVRRYSRKMAGSDVTSQRSSASDSADLEEAGPMVGIIIEASESELRDVLQSARLLNVAAPGAVGDLSSSFDARIPALADGAIDGPTSGPTSDNDSVEFGRPRILPKDEKRETVAGRELNPPALTTPAEETPQVSIEGRRPSSPPAHLAGSADSPSRTLLLFRLIEPKPSQQAEDTSPPLD